MNNAGSGTFAFASRNHNRKGDPPAADGDYEE